MRERKLELGEVVAVNGGARSALWRQILCDALGAPLAYVPDAPGAPAGAALLAGLGVGAVAGVDAAKAWRGPVQRHAPDGARTAVYEAMVAERIELYHALREVV
jgi:sugar (pentulose or hexulose) kinase